MTRYITVEDALNAMCDSCDAKHAICAHYPCKHYEAVECTPSADVVERKKGEWEFIGGYGYQYRCTSCLMCAEHKTKYCQNCGAEMR